MASKHVEDAIAAYLAAKWTLCPVLTMNLDGEAPSDGSNFIELQFPVANVERMSVGTRLYKEQGGFRIEFNVRRGEGMGTVRQYGETIGALFRDVMVEDVHCLVPSEPFTDDRSDEGNWFTSAVVVPFWRSFQG